jgi:uncharacterized membrane protein
MLIFFLLFVYFIFFTSVNVNAFNHSVISIIPSFLISIYSKEFFIKAKFGIGRLSFSNKSLTNCLYLLKSISFDIFVSF